MLYSELASDDFKTDRIKWGDEQSLLSKNPSGLFARGQETLSFQSGGKCRHSGDKEEGCLIVDDTGISSLWSFLAWACCLQGVDELCNSWFLYSIHAF